MELPKLDTESLGSPFADQLKRGFPKLRFNGLLEKEFREFYVQQNLPRARLSGLIAIILVLAVTCIDFVARLGVEHFVERAAARGALPHARGDRRRYLAAGRTPLLQ